MQKAVAKNMEKTLGVPVQRVRACPVDFYFIQNGELHPVVPGHVFADTLYISRLLKIVRDSKKIKRQYIPTHGQHAASCTNPRPDYLGPGGLAQ
jgi:hypothetical protein